MDENKDTKGPWWQPPLLFFAKLNSWILGPVIVAFFVGQWLDKKLGTGPWLFVFFIAASFVFSIMKMVAIARHEIKKHRIGK